MLDPVKPYQPAVVTAAPSDPSRLRLATQGLTALALLGTLQFHLLGSLLAGLLLYELVHVLAPDRHGALVQHRTAKIIVVALLAAVVAAVVGAGVLGLVALLASGPDNLALLLRKMAEVIETARSHLPAWALGFLPEESTEI